MRIHHLNCGTMCPWGGRLMDGHGGGPHRAHLVCHCLLIETDAHGLVLVDTGFGLRDVATPRPRLAGFFLASNRPQLRESETAVRQIQALGHSVGDVRHIVLTHLDFDHAGGLEDFPGATVHVLERELRAARDERTGFIASRRYRPGQWDDGVRWSPYAPQGESWFGFDCVRDLPGLPPEILMVPLAGHTWGHAGVAVSGPGGWLLQAGDAYFYRHEMDVRSPRCTPGLSAYQRMMEVDRAARLHNQERLRGLLRQHGGEVRVVCSHDAAELEACRNQL
ncbi:MAG TPA: MBL fold metallo-hydrolase [Alphaproteobacteria bacterium]|nr:MBL fold metallo-hydrolase [Alphaproteobacteria bacterium]